MTEYIKKIAFASFALYAFNMIAVNFNIVIPINFWTIIFTSIFDVTGILIIFILKLICV